LKIENVEIKESRKYLIVVLGPTAAGKTSVAIQLAQRFSAEIISSDARQFFRQMNIGTAKPDADELSAIPHHFINTLDIQEKYNAGKYEEEAIPLIAKLHEQSNFVLMAGGSGLYVKGVLEGFDELPPQDADIRERLETSFAENGIEVLQEELKRFDPDTFPLIDHLNPRRLMRAIEVFEITGRSFLSFHQKSKKQRAFETVKIGLQWERPQLYERINLRVDQMMEAGLLEEVRQLLPFSQLNALQTVGYAELFDHLKGKTSLKEAVELIKRNTRRYAKRQTTWFGKDEEINWFKPGEFQSIADFLEEKCVQ